MNNLRYLFKCLVNIPSSHKLIFHSLITKNYEEPQQLPQPFPKTTTPTTVTALRMLT